MKQWEYCTVYSTSKDTTVTYHLPKRQIKQRDFDATVSNLGLEGWELVAAWNGGFYFKRELQQRPPPSP